MNPAKIFLIVCGWIALVLGVIGIFLPILPTTPFIITAALCFSKSSERMHRWLLNLPLFGPMIDDWDQHGVINVRAKALATATIIALFSLTVIFVKVALWIKITVVCIGTSILIFILTRPSTRPLGNPVKKPDVL